MIEVCCILGIKSFMEFVIFLLFGFVDLIFLEMVGVYVIFVNNGWYFDMMFIV